MDKILLTIIAICLCATNIKAQITQMEYAPNMEYDPVVMDNEFTIYWGFEEKITTELIKCSSASNVYTKIEIMRNYGIPRYGITTDCNNNIDTVWYIPTILNGTTSGGIVLPAVTDTSITVWWREGNYNVKIMDVLTGNIVLDETNDGLMASLFREPINPDSLIGNINAETGKKIIDFGEFFPPLDNNQGTTINYSNLSNGLYWIYIINEKNLICYMQTIRKGI